MCTWSRLSLFSQNRSFLLESPTILAKGTWLTSHEPLWKYIPCFFREMHFCQCIPCVEDVLHIKTTWRLNPDEKRGVLLNFPNSQQNPESSWWFFTLSDTAGWHELLFHCLQIMFGLMHPFVLQSYQDMTAWRQKPTNVREGIFPIGECVARLWFFPIHSLLSSQIPIIP